MRVYCTKFLDFWARHPYYVGTEANNQGSTMCDTTIPAGVRKTYRNKPAMWETNPELASQLVDPQDGWKLTAGSGKKANWTCGKHAWTCSPNISSRGGYYGCPYCSGKKACADSCLSTVNPKLASELVDKSLATKLTHRSNKKVSWTCGKHTWTATVYNRSNGSGCPDCAANSRMNKWTSELLSSLELDFSSEVRFDDCRSVYALPFDACILDADKKVSALIECQGRQHYEAVELFGGYEAFAKQQKHDQIKRDFCKSEGIPLIEISYTFRDKGEKAFKTELGRLIKESLNKD
jgi:glutaredoxin